MPCVGQICGSILVEYFWFFYLAPTKNSCAARFVRAKTRCLGFVFLPSYEDREAQGILHDGRIARGQIPAPKLLASNCSPDDMILTISWADVNATTFWLLPCRQRRLCTAMKYFVPVKRADQQLLEVCQGDVENDSRTYMLVDVKCALRLAAGSQFL